MSFIHIFFTSVFLFVFLSAPLYATSLQRQHTIGKEDLRHTEEAKVLKTLNDEIRELKEDYKRAKSKSGKESIRRAAREIKDSEEYGNARKALEPLLRKTITCYGSMCDDPGWTQMAVNMLIKRPAFSHCYYTKKLQAKCQRWPPAKHVVLERDENDESEVIVSPSGDGSGSPGLPSSVGGLIPGGGDGYDCPIPFRKNANIHKPYWGVLPGPLGTTGHYSCGVCDKNWNWKGLKSSYCKGPSPGN